MARNHTPLGLWLLGQMLNGPVVDADFFEENGASKFRAIIIKKGSYRARYGILFPQYTSLRNLFDSSNDPIFVWRYGDTFSNAVWSGLFFLLVQDYPMQDLAIAPSKVVPDIWDSRFRFYNTNYYVVSGPENLFLQAANGNFTGCTVEETVTCAPSLTLSSGILTVAYNVSIPFRCTRRKVLHLRLKHNIQFVTTSASTTYDLCL